MWLLPNRNRRVTLVNLALCRPALSHWQRLNLARRSLVEDAKTALEAPILWHASGQRVRRLVGGVDDVSGMFDRLATGGSALIAAPHLGAWELLCMAISQRAPLTALYRPAEQRWLDDLTLAGRSRLGANMVPATPGAIRGLFRQIGKPGAIGILPDQRPKRGNGVFATQCGVPTLTMTLFGRLAQRADKQSSLLVIGIAERLSWGRGFRLHLHPLPTAVADPDDVVAATALNDAIMAFAERWPAQYQWSYKRFSIQPDPADNPYRT